MEFIEKVNTFEALYAAYIAKLARLDELKTNVSVAWKSVRTAST